MPIANQHQLLDDIDARQNEVLDQLDELNRQIEAMIDGIVGARGPIDDKKREISAVDQQSHSTDSDLRQGLGRVSEAA